MCIIAINSHFNYRCCYYYYYLKYYCQSVKKMQKSEIIIYNCNNYQHNHRHQHHDHQQHNQQQQQHHHHHHHHVHCNEQKHVNRRRDYETKATTYFSSISSSTPAVSVASVASIFAGRQFKICLVLICNILLQQSGCATAFTLLSPFSYTSLSFKNLLNSVLLSSNGNLAGGGRNLKSDVLEDASLITPKLIRKYGYPSETHTVVTKDGYILEMHRLPKKGAQPVLLMHGILDTSATWVLMGPKSGLGYILWDLGYDVWMGNSRGNRYSKNHTSLNSDYMEFWDFTFHEMGKYDLPAIIDYILSKTGYNQLHYVGHSQGTAVFWVLCSEQPSYAQKILSMHALAPIAFISDMKSPLFRTLVLFLDFLTAATRMLRITEFMPNTKFLVDHSQVVCHDNAMTQDVCSNILFLVAGYNSEQLNKTMLPVMLSHTPSGASIKQLEHFGQLMKSGHFRKFDRGYLRNQLEYNRVTPPDYDLSRVKVPVALYHSVNDLLVSTTGVDRLARELPYVIDKYLVPMEKFNHLDFLWAIDVKSLVYNRLVRNIRRVENYKQKYAASANNEISLKLQQQLQLQQQQIQQQLSKQQQKEEVQAAAIILPSNHEHDSAPATTTATPTITTTTSILASSLTAALHVNSSALPPVSSTNANANPNQHHHNHHNAHHEQASIEFGAQRRQLRLLRNVNLNTHRQQQHQQQTRQRRQQQQQTKLQNKQSTRSS